MGVVVVLLAVITTYKKVTACRPNVTPIFGLSEEEGISLSRCFNDSNKGYKYYLDESPSHSLTTLPQPPATENALIPELILVGLGLLFEKDGLDGHIMA